MDHITEEMKAELMKALPDHGQFKMDAATFLELVATPMRISLKHPEVDAATVNNFLRSFEGSDLEKHPDATVSLVQDVGCCLDLIVGLQLALALRPRPPEIEGLQARIKEFQRGLSDFILSKAPKMAARVPALLTL